MCVPFSRWFAELQRHLPPDYKDAPLTVLEEECLDMWNENRSPAEASALIVELAAQKRAEMA